MLTAYFAGKYVDISPDRVYTYRKTATIASALINPAASRVQVAKFPFTIHTRSLLVARVYYQYTVNELRLTLVPSTPQMGEVVYLPRHYKNSNEIDTVIAAKLSLIFTLFLTELFLTNR